jgi:serine protease Do
MTYSAYVEWCVARLRRNAGMSLAALILLGSAFILRSAEAQEQKPGRVLVAALQEAFVSVADEVEPAVVTVTAKKTVRPKSKSSTDEDDSLLLDPFGRPSTGRPFRSEGTGSGVIISPDGWVLTNDHVVGGADKVTVKLRDGREFDGTVRRDYRSDLALVKLNASDLPMAKLGDSDKVKIGQWAIAIGSPYRYEGSFSVGVVSSLGRRQEIRDRSGEGEGRLYPDMIQTDAAINPGNSGGPLVNIDGEVIAINTAIESETGGSVGIGFAIPINSAKFVIEQLKTKGKVSYGYMGVDPDTVTPRLASAYKVTGGALVRSEPLENSPAAKAGIHVDDVITEIDGKAIKNELDLRTTVSRIAPGSTVSVTYVRAGEEKTAKATISEAPPARVTKRETPTVQASLGIEVATVTPEQAGKVGVSSAKPEGVGVKALDSGLAVSETEMRVGDVIVKVNDVPTPTVEAFKKATDKLKSGDIVRVVYLGRRVSDIVKRVAIVTVD